MSHQQPTDVLKLLPATYFAELNSFARVQSDHEEMEQSATVGMEGRPNNIQLQQQMMLVLCKQDKSGRLVYI